MAKIIAKRVSMLELFYDLIFVYAISRITMLIHHPVNGVLPIRNYVEFLIVVICVMQIWLYQTIYINRFGSGRVIDNAGLLISMFAAFYLANNINLEWNLTFYAFNTSMLITVINLIWQFVVGSTDHPWKNQDIRAFIITLGLELLAIVTGLSIGYRYGIYLVVLGILIGFLVPLAIYPMFKPQLVNFPHLVERLGLLVIITFGEMIVNTTNYFQGAIWAPLPLVVFLFVASLFGVYNLLVDKFINDHQLSRGFIAMYTHVVIIVNLLSITAGIVYTTNPHASRLFLSIFMTSNILIFYLCLWALNSYHRVHLRFNTRDISIMGAVLITGDLGGIAVGNNTLLLMTCLALVNLLEFVYLEYKLHHVEES